MTSDELFKKLDKACAEIDSWDEERKKSIIYKFNNENPIPGSKEFLEADVFQSWLAKQEYPQGKNLSKIALLTIGLGGESGEAIELIKKHLRDGTPIDMKHLQLELGDILIIVALIAQHFNMKLSEVMESAVHKIDDRSKRGVMRGSGDDR